jgi:protein associated with RNAse G/E
MQYSPTICLSKNPTKGFTKVPSFQGSLKFQVLKDPPKGFIEVPSFQGCSKRIHKSSKLSKILQKDSPKLQAFKDPTEGGFTKVSSKFVKNTFLTRYEKYNENSDRKIIKS